MIGRRSRVLTTTIVMLASFAMAAWRAAAIPPPSEATQVLASAGGEAIGGTFRLQSTMGQSFVGSTTGGGNAIVSGYWGPPPLDGDWTACGLGSMSTFTFNRTSKVALSVAIPGTLACLRVKRTDAAHPNAVAGIDPTRYWTLTGENSAGGSAASFAVSLTFPQPTLATPSACRNAGGSIWDCAVSSSTSTTVTRDAVTQFSDWAIGNSPCLTDSSGPTVTPPASAIVTQTLCQ